MCTLDAGFFEPAREAGFLAVVEGGLADARDGAWPALEAGLADSARDAGLVAPSALDGGFAALEAGFATALESGLAYDADR